MKLLLTSAGLNNQSIIKAFSHLVGLPNDKIKIAFIPTAANVEEEDKSWLIEDYINLKKQEYGCIDIVDIASVSKDIWLPRLKEANAIFVGGGNTFFLMSWLKKSGLDKILPELLKSRVYVGISAGSMVATVNLRLSTSPKSYSEKVFPLENNEGLDFVNFHILPHFNSEFFSNARVEYLKEEAKEIPETIYAIDDDTAIMVNAGKIEIVSEGNWKKFN